VAGCRAPQRPQLAWPAGLGEEYRPVMATPSPGRHGAPAASLWRLPRSLAHPVVLTFVVAAYFSYVTGDTVRAGYLLGVGLALAWDQARRRAPSRSPGTGEAEVTAFSQESVERRRAAMQRWLIPAVLAGVVYSVAVGSLHRYSWPATIAVNIPAVAGVLVAWRVSAGSAREPGRLRPAGLAAWALVWTGAAVWELTALYMQPTLDTDSYAHPTLSYLADPVLTSALGRSAVLFAWLAFGWYLARR
jgi:hypothetical protein